MKFYIKLDGDIIRDIIEYEYVGYTEVDIPTPLPIGINAGYYRWQNGTAVLDESLKSDSEQGTPVEGLTELEQRVSATEAEAASLNLAIIDIWETIATNS
ncbi:hypothetical protein BK124_11595 [Paenibacillus amylolyticus]|uniref:hypothetical protein n=1 Tax=Paenibacillus amylolyticus TaxID=1451 RepID=UPI00096DCFA7|nr:hypothetical protein [Paenibacillus amylolyticus]OMF00292.1 hypothetical protein BK124_11595 [Paenibacillus amylolyticus]